MTNLRRTELQYLENYRLLFTNLDEVKDLKTELAEYGYDEAKIREGKTLYQNVQTLYDQNKKETAEEKEAYALFSKAFQELKTSYNKHRKIAKVALVKHPELWETLGIKGETSSAYLRNVEEMKTLYTQAQSHTTAKPILEKFKLTETIAQQQLTKIGEVEALRASYEKEKGESQDATKQKDKAFDTLSEWIKEFYAVAKIALDDRPQLLESIGKFVRS